MHPKLALALLMALLGAGALPPAARAQGAADQQDIVVTDVQVAGDLVNVTVASYSRSFLIDSAGLFENGTLVSNGTGGQWLQPGVPSVLAFHLQRATKHLDLSVTYEYFTANNTTRRQVTQPLALPAGADVRPVDAWLADGGNVTVALRNFGSQPARELLLTLVNHTGASIALPYYRALDALAPSATTEVHFTLLDTSEEPSIVVEADGARSTYAVKVRTGNSTAAALGQLTMTTDLPALEGAAGGSVSYTLHLQNKGAERLVALRAEGVPEAYSATFSVAGSRVQTVLLAAGATRDVTFTVGVPTLAADAGAAPLPLNATVSDASNGARLATLPLTLRVTGAEHLELSGRNWFASASPGDPLDIRINIENTGTAAAHDVALSAQPPSGWDARFTPQRLARIGVGETANVTMHVTVPATTAEGRYVLDINAQSPSSAARQRSFSVDVALPPSGSGVPWMLAAGGAGIGALALVVYMRRK